MHEYSVYRMLLLVLLLLGLVITAAAASTDGDTSWRSDLPWLDELQSKLSSSKSSSSSSSSSEQQVLLLDTTPSNYINECIPTFNVAWPSKTNHALINQPSGMCLPHLFCAFQDCYLSDPKDDSSSSTTLSDRYKEQAGISIDTLYSDLDDDKKDKITDTSNPHYNLPRKVLFPLVASDVIAAVKFAKKHGLELSVKNSGHSYTAASTKKDTLLLNMNKYTSYASEASDHGITDCDDDANTTAAATLTGQPCRLSLAKGKSAVIRVGGGENWGESIY